jgi:hypothetical protein
MLPVVRPDDNLGNLGFLDRITVACMEKALGTHLQKIRQASPAACRIFEAFSFGWDCSSPAIAEQTSMAWP